MIQFVVDQDSCYDGSFDIYCHDSSSYVQSRLLIDEVKTGLRESLVVLLSPTMVNYYLDLRSVPGWTEWNFYSYQRILEEYTPALNRNQVEEMEAILGSKAAVIKFLRTCDNNLELDENLLTVIYFQGDKLKNIKNEIELWEWFEASVANGRMDWLNASAQKLLLRLISGFSRFLWELVFSINDRVSLDIARKNLIATYLFNDYPQSNKNILRQKLVFRDSLYFGADLAERLILGNSSAVEEINHAVFSVRDNLSIFELSDLDGFLRRSKGYLSEEWHWVWTYVKCHIYEDSIQEELNKILAWTGIARPELMILQRLFELMLVIENDYIPEIWEDWANFYTEVYLQWFPSLEREQNIIHALEEINLNNEGFLDKIIIKIQNYKENKETQYQDFLFRAFPDLVNSGFANIRLFTELAGYLEQEKAFLLVIDGLRWEIWGVVRAIIEDNGYFLENSNQYSVSMIPSITSVSRIALLSGKVYANLVKEKQEGIFTHGVFDEARQVKRFFKSKKVAFKVGALDDLNDLLAQDVDLYVFVFSQADHILHGAGDINRKALEAMLGEVIRELLKRIESRQGMVLAIATDHGSIKVTGKEQVNPPVSEVLLSESHGNSVLLWRESEGEDSVQQIDSSIDTEKWYVLPGGSVGRYGLPLKDQNGKIALGWLFPKNRYYVGKKSGNYTHGGLSMQETIIPHGIFRKQELVYQQLLLEMGSNYIATEESSYVEIFIFNPNPFGLKKVEVNSTAIALREIIRDFAPKARKKVRWNFVPGRQLCQNGRFQDQVEVVVNYRNSTVQQSYFVNIPVKVTEEQKSIKDDVGLKRTLDF